MVVVVVDDGDDEDDGVDEDRVVFSDIAMFLISIPLSNLFTPSSYNHFRNVHRLQCLAKVFGPLELCDLLSHFRLQT